MNSSRHWLILRCARKGDSTFPYGLVLSWAEWDLALAIPAEIIPWWQLLHPERAGGKTSLGREGLGVSVVCLMADSWFSVAVRCLSCDYWPESCLDMLWPLVTGSLCCRCCCKLLFLKKTKACFFHFKDSPTSGSLSQALVPVISSLSSKQISASVFTSLSPLS